MLRRVLLPAPDGPIIPVSSPDRNRPLTSLRIVLTSAIKGIERQLNTITISQSISLYYTIMNESMHNGTTK